MSTKLENKQELSNDIYTVLATAIINNNYAIQSVFDDVPEHLVKKHLSKIEAEKLIKTYKRTHLTSYEIVKKLAIIGIVPFNKNVAYIFNKELPNSEALDNITITSEGYENLMDCYVFCSKRISEKYLKQLEKEYYERGGVIYQNYHAFEKIELLKTRKTRKRNFRNKIVFDSIFQHGFREIGKQKWSNGNIIIKEKQTQRSSIKYPSGLNHTQLNTSFDNKVLIGSIFAGYYEHINQLDGNTFGIICSTKNTSRYNFTYFEVSVGCS